MSRTRTFAALFLLLPLLTLGLGCYETQFPLGSADKASVDPAYVGDYVFTEDNKNSTITIRNIDNRLYYVEWLDSTDDKPNRMIGYTAAVNGAAFANLRGLTDDGSIDNKYLVMRIDLSPDRAHLTLRNLKDDFFKGKDVSSSAALEKTIGENLDNPQMYDGDAVVAARVAAPSATTTISLPATKSP